MKNDSGSRFLFTTVCGRYSTRGSLVNCRLHNAERGKYRNLPLLPLEVTPMSELSLARLVETINAELGLSIAFRAPAITSTLPFACCLFREP